ncbi:hypothetical protein BH23ACT9_BH23ACT9_28450 [soil metagenome]
MGCSGVTSAHSSPAGVLAQAWRGGPQANLSRLIAGCTVWTLAEDAAACGGSAVQGGRHQLELHQI